MTHSTLEPVSQQQLLELNSLVHRFSEGEDYYCRASSNYNEHSCRDEFINPFLRILGWDVENRKGLPPQVREVVIENYSSESERPDYSLNVRGVAKFFVEAKKPSVNIVDHKDPALQARKYGWNANHKIAILTNFADFVIYDCTVAPNEHDGASVARYRKFHYTEYVDKIEEIRNLCSRESVFAGVFDEVFASDFGQQSSERERVDQMFLRQINEWRIQLASSLVSNNAVYNDPEKLNDAVQDLINQLVFLRICEDKCLPVYKTLSSLLEEQCPATQGMSRLLKEIDKRYNSGLFAEDCALNDVDDATLRAVVEELYYPKSPYLFDIIEPSIFGQIYEMFLSEQLEVVDGRVSIIPKAEYKDRSVVATPIDIVRYIVERTLDPLCRGKNPSEIKQLAIADIACGSGVFLLESFQYLVNCCIDWYYNNNLDHLIETENHSYQLPFSDKKEILTSCIYGVDVDSHAVEVAKLSLLIKLVENENSATVYGEDPILPNLGETIVLGNSLVSSQEARLVNTPLEELKSIIPFCWDSINGGEKFDAIVGNPPYVKTEDIHALLSDYEFKSYKKTYKSAYKQFDKYFLFIERSMSLLKEDGSATFIVPNKFFKIASGSKLRALIAKGEALAMLDDFGDAQLFEEKTIYSSIVFLKSKPQAFFTYSSIEATEDLWLDRSKNSIQVDESVLDANPWKLTTDFEFMKFIVWLDSNSVKLSDFVEPFNGIQTSAERRRNYWFLDREICAMDEGSITFSRDDRNWTIERAILRRYFKPTEEHGFNSYSDLECDKWMIFPYDAEGRLIPIAEMECDYPGAWAYLNSQKEDLWPRQLEGNGTRDVPNSTPETWYQYGRTQALSSFNGTEKIIVGILSDEPLYFIDRDNWLIASGGTAGYCGLRLRSECPYALEYIQAWLSNEITERYFDLIGSDFEGGFKSRGTSLLNVLPFIELDFSDSAQASLHEKVVRLSKRVQSDNCKLRESLSHRERTVVERDKDESIKEISDLIKQVYYMRYKDET